MISHESSRRSDRYIRAALGILAVVLIILCTLLLREYRQLRQQNILFGRAQWISVLEKHQHGTVTDVNFIQPWMTFDYISMLYGIPTTDLKTSLGIIDTRFPRISISSYARANHLDARTILANVKSAVSAYLAGHTDT